MLLHARAQRAPIPGRSRCAAAPGRSRCAAAPDRSRCAAALLAGILASCVAASCVAAPGRTTAAGLAPPAVGPHYRAFPSADSLGGYLRAGSAAGPLLSAHRGGPVPGYPENALVTFERTLTRAPALLETDVRLTGDSVLVLLHDDELDRTTTGTGPVEGASLAELRLLRLEDAAGVATPYRIPTLAEALAWAKGRAVLMLDVKSGTQPERVVAAVRAADAANRAVVIVYTHDELLRYQRLAPEIVISFSPESVADVERALGAGINARRLIGFTGVGELRPAVIAALHAHGIRAQLGTFDAIDAQASVDGAAVYRALLAQGVDVIATDSVDNAAAALGRP